MEGWKKVGEGRNILSRGEKKTCLVKTQRSAKMIEITFGEDPKKTKIYSFMKSPHFEPPVPPGGSALARRNDHSKCSTSRIPEISQKKKKKAAKKKKCGKHLFLLGGGTPNRAVFKKTD